MIITARVRSTTEGTVFTGVCMSTPGGRGVPQGQDGGNPKVPTLRPGQDGGGGTPMHLPPGQAGQRGTPMYLPPWPGQDRGGLPESTYPSTRSGQGGGSTQRYLSPLAKVGTPPNQGEGGVSQSTHPPAKVGMPPPPPPSQGLVTWRAVCLLRCFTY